MTLEYAPTEEQVTVTVAYGGERFDPAEGDNELSYMVLKRAVDDLAFSFDPEREAGNVVRVLIREKA